MLDCDPGLDDALAILLALGSPEKIDVKAIIATFGNVGLSQAKANLLRILGFFKKVPLLGSGSKGPLKGNAPEARGAHGRNGLGDLDSYTTGAILRLRSGQVNRAPTMAAGRPIFKNGIDLILDLALSNKINTIAATGPLTDLARGIKKAPALLKNVDEVVIMGGAVFVKGNVTPYAEFNFYCDPAAAKIVLNTPAKKRLVALDVTHKTLLTARQLKPLRAIKSPLAKFICHIADYSIRSGRKRGFSGAPMHDPLAVALAIDPGMGEYENLRLDVEKRGKGRGRVVVKKGKPNALFCRSVDVDKFFKLFIGALTKLAKRDR